MGAPASRSVRDYVLNTGAFQLPLHTGALFPPRALFAAAAALRCIPPPPCAEPLHPAAPRFQAAAGPCPLLC